jgi:nicotinamidase-related amidase
LVTTLRENRESTVSRTALLVMDVQRRIVERFAVAPDYLTRLAGAIAAARAHAVPVIYVVIGFRDGYPEVSSRNRAFAALADIGHFNPADPGAAITPEIAPADGDVIVTKRRVSAFAGSDLDVVLRARDVDQLVLTGIATSGVVLSTLRQAADLDFRLTVLADCCLDMDAEVHRVLTEKVFARQADVVAAEQWTGGLDA